jgi:3-hydroxyacyl-CoA dehydrogenase
MNGADYLNAAIERLKAGVADYPADRHIAVIGAGTMGAGIALAALKAGYRVTLSETAEAPLRRAGDWIEREFHKTQSRGEWKADDPADMLRRVLSLDELGDPDIVIEAAYESLAVKQQIFSQLRHVCGPQTLLGTNTSTLDIDAIASVTGRDENVVGLHFFSPAHVMPLLEIVRGRDTNTQSITRARALSNRLGKVGVVVGNCYGFAGNRMVEGVFREVDRLLIEGARPTEIDNALQNFGMAMGPCKVLDLVGLDVPYKARRENSQAASGDVSYYALCDAMVDRGWLGRKSGSGFYIYEDDQGIDVVNDRIESLAGELAGQLGIERRDATSSQEIIDRIVLPWSLEAARLSQEGIVESSEHADVIACLGYGYPRGLGGPMRHGNAIGYDTIVSRVEPFSVGREPYWEVPAESYWI